METQLNLRKWWNRQVLPMFEQQVDQLMAEGMTRTEANDAIVAVMLHAVRRRHAAFFRRIINGPPNRPVAPGAPE